MSLTDTQSAPILAGPVPPEKQLSLFQFLRVAKENVLNAVPRFAHEQPISHTNFGLGRVVLVADLAAVKHVLLDNVANFPKAEMQRRALGAALGEGILVSDGEKWRSHRRLMAPSFDHKSIVFYAPGMVDCIDAYLRNWDRGSPARAEQSPIRIPFRSARPGSAPSSRRKAAITRPLTPNAAAATDHGYANTRPHSQA
jgi:cytochrome P450